MDRRTLDLTVSMVFGGLVVCSALWFTSALTPICVVGGILVGLYWAVLRQKLPAPTGTVAAGPAAADRQDAPVREDDPPYGSV